MNSPHTSRGRPLYTWEIQEAWRVFGNHLDYERVRVHERAGWTNRVDRFGTWLIRMPYSGRPNAITLGNHCYFPIRMLAVPVPITHPEHFKAGWLIHELTHIWQFQCIGWRYLALALSAQFELRGKAYDFGDETGLIEYRRKGWKLEHFNLEQQGDITRTYYERLCQGGDACAWLPYIMDIQQG